ncbi:MAG TPA: hypothetical protein VM889_12850 [Candidatus Thermoplasmatota archaeon]|nr:hypothetical protein [Candidatus Thermoplasmatota archaeon]
MGYQTCRVDAAERTCTFNCYYGGELEVVGNGGTITANCGGAWASCTSTGPQCRGYSDTRSAMALGQCVFVGTGSGVCYAIGGSALPECTGLSTWPKENGWPTDYRCFSPLQAEYNEGFVTCVLFVAWVGPLTTHCGTESQMEPLADAVPYEWFTASTASAGEDGHRLIVKGGVPCMSHAIAKLEVPFDGTLVQFWATCEITLYQGQYLTTRDSVCSGYCVVVVGPRSIFVEELPE